MSERTPTLGHVIRASLGRAMADMRVAMPGRIEKFDKATQLADVKPLLKETYEDDTGTAVIESLPVIVNVPVYSAGGGDFALTMPIAQGDSCWLMFSDRSLDIWNESGGEQNPVDARRHDLSDAVCIVGVRPKAGKLSEYDGSAVELGKLGGPRVRVKGDSVHLGVGTGEDSTELAAFASKVKTELSALHDKLENFVSTFNTHTHTVSTAGPPLAHTGTAAPTLSQGPILAPVGEVKCEKVFIK